MSRGIIWKLIWTHLAITRRFDVPQEIMKKLVRVVMHFLHCSCLNAAVVICRWASSGVRIFIAGNSNFTHFCTSTSLTLHFIVSEMTSYEFYSWVPRLCLGLFHYDFYYFSFDYEMDSFISRSFQWITKCRFRWMNIKVKTSNIWS